MTIARALKSEEGFTIQELLVAIVAGSLLVAFGFSLYLFVAKIVQRDMRGREHQENALRTVERIVSDIEGSALVSASTDSSLELESPRRGTRFYCMRQGVLFRDGVTLGPADGERWAIRFRQVSPGTIMLTFKSFWGKDSTEARAEASIPRSSAGMFSAKDTTQGAFTSGGALQNSLWKPTSNSY